LHRLHNGWKAAVVVHQLCAVTQVAAAGHPVVAVFVPCVGLPLDDDLQQQQQQQQKAWLCLQQLLTNLSVGMSN
jgi:hypothetical protein